MASSTQFSIRGLMAITVAVAIISAVVAPWIPDLKPQERPRAAVYLLCLAIPVSAVVGKSCILRRRIEKAAGALIARSAIRGDAMRWASFTATIPLSILAANGIMLLAKSDLFGDSLACWVTGCSTLFFGFAAAGLGLHCWWGTGYFVTEAFENGLVFRGLVFRPWSDLAFYEPSPHNPGVLIVNMLARRGLASIRIRVAAKDHAEWNRILAEHGVPPANFRVKSGPSTTLDC